MIIVNNVTKYYGSFKALSDVSMKVDKGSIYGFVGSNGAGKSTLMRIISGIYKVDGGQVLIDGEDVYDNPSVKSRIAFVPDDLYFIPGANLKRMADLYSATREHFDRKKFEWLISSINLDAKKSTNEFSKGMKRQAATMLALACDPDYLMFDETFDGLDPIMRNHIKSIICEDVEARGATAIITSHSLRELSDTCDQLALLHKGGMVLESEISALKTKHLKVQIGFREPFTEDKFASVPYSSFIKHGSVCTMIIPGSSDEAINRLKAMEPAILDILPLSLEEVFTYELETLGYRLDGQEDLK